MRNLSIAALVAVLGGCEAARMIAPNTVAGFESGGILGALDGATGAILARCNALDGLLVQMAVDGAAISSGRDDTVERLRTARRAACAAAAAASRGP